jgi:hypothetical protein
VELLGLLQHSLSFADPFRKDRHSAFEVCSIWFLSGLKLDSLLCKLCTPGESFTVTFETRCRRLGPGVVVQLLPCSLNQALKVR